MQTRLDPRIQQREYAETVNTILRKCVHCGFCNATCPTYQLLGDELDGPRGRIYQMKQFFEGEPANAEMMLHLDRCLTCRSCETTCPSGVQYSHLLEIGREAIEEEYQRPWFDRFQRKAILQFILSGWPFRLSIRLGQLFRGLMPSSLRSSIPARQPAISRARGNHERKVLMLAGCVQGALTPNTNILANNLLDSLGIEVIEIPPRFCCGSAASHTSAAELGRKQAKLLIDAFWPHIENGAEAIVINATGCGVSIRDYARLFADDPDYASKAERVSALYCDLVEMVERELERIPTRNAPMKRVAVHTPCTMQHGLKLSGRVERILEHCGYQICRIEEAHLCCGSAGTYSMLQKDISTRLRDNKLRALSVDQPDVIASANIGCQVQLGGNAEVPVVHWIELLQAD